jgi:hypothetical protein
MRFGLAVVSFVCLAIMAPLIYFNRHDSLIIGMTLFAFVPYLAMCIGIMFSKKMSRILLGKEKK